jgi:Putative peptidoglycan binding domain
MTAVSRHRLSLATLLTLATIAFVATAVAPAAHAASGRARASARVATPRLVFLRCSSVPFPCRGHRVVTRTGRLLVGAGGMSGRAKVLFPIRFPSGRTGTRGVGGRFRSSTRIVVRVPRDAISGRIRVVNPGGRRSNAKWIVVRRAPQRPRPPRGVQPITGPSAFDGNGMWIWYLARSHSGSASRIAEQAQEHGVRTIFVKSADADDVWSQFNATAVAELKATGLKVCGWQFVYGNDPIGEAEAAAAAKEAGADCFVIDAEGHYEGKYAQAQRYVTKLRELVGPDFPIGLTSFPYVDYHPGLPYSVFMGPGGATFNLPQVYWKTIGDSVDESLAHTYQWNIPYETPIFPLGQTYDGPRAADVTRFRQLSHAYGARGLSWWVWQYASASDWDALAAPIADLPAPERLWPTLRAGVNGRVGSRGDLVVWAQQHLVGAGAGLRVDGEYGPGTADAVRTFQSDANLPVTGEIDAATWPTLLRTTPIAVDWVARTQASGARAAGVGGVTGPVSAGLPAKRYEIPPGPGR